MTNTGPLAKVLLYSHDTYGLGHLRRNLAIARHLLSQPGAPQVVLASGSPVLNQVDRPERLICAQLPPVTKTGPEQYRPLEPGVPMSVVTRARTAVLSDIVLRWEPDVLLVDHSPHGVKGELLGVFDLIRSRHLATRLVLGLRDILDEPASVRRTWADQGVYGTLRDTYDQVVVYGEREVFDVVEAYAIPEPLASGVEFCGYVTSEATSPPRPALEDGYLLGTVGGGGDGVEVLLATLGAAQRLGAPAVLCAGPLMNAADRQVLAAAVADHARSGLEVRLLDHVQDLPGLAREARCVVTRGGYNTLCELLAISVPVVVVPRAWPRQEQLLRARAFAERGLVHMVEPDGGDLGQEVTRAVNAATTTPGARRRPLDLQGAQRVVDALSRVAAGQCADGDLEERIPA
jgi:predicted glycosyltransferase